MSITCDCSDEYGPCDLHGAPIIIREGAAVRTADELSVVFIEDAQSLGAALSSYGLDVLARANAALDAHRSMGVAWLNDDALHDEVMTVQSQMETELFTLGYLVHWEDGFRVSRPTPDCPLTSEA